MTLTTSQPTAHDPSVVDIGTSAGSAQAACAESARRRIARTEGEDAATAGAMRVAGIASGRHVLFLRFLAMFGIATTQLVPA
jgi:hypothetical protein